SSSGSVPVMEYSSANTVLASSKETECFLRFAAALSWIPVEAHTLPRLALSAEQPEQRIVTDLHQSEPHRHAEHEGEGKVRHTVELEEQCRENPEQRERP